MKARTTSWREKKKYWIQTVNLDKVIRSHFNCSNCFGIAFFLFLLLCRQNDWMCHENESASTECEKRENRRIQFNGKRKKRQNETKELLILHKNYMRNKLREIVWAYFFFRALPLQTVCRLFFVCSLPSANVPDAFFWPSNGKQFSFYQFLLAIEAHRFSIDRMKYISFLDDAAGRAKWIFRKKRTAKWNNRKPFGQY